MDQVIISKRVLVIGHSLLSESESILVTRCTSYEFSQLNYKECAKWN